MKYFLIILSFLFIHSCGSDPSGSSETTKQVVDVETFTKNYSYNDGPMDEIIKEIVMTTIDDDQISAKLTFDDNSIKNYDVEVLEEGEETEIGFQFEDMCQGVSSDALSGFFNIVLKGDENIYLTGLAFEGKCDDVGVSCIAFIQLDNFDDENVLHGFVMDAETQDVTGNCLPIQNQVENLLDSQFED